MQDYKAILEEDTYYHVYNRANGSEKLFLNDNNYLYFLRKYNYYISPIAHTFAYCLMPNHFHFLVKIKDIATLQVALHLHLQGIEDLEDVGEGVGVKSNKLSKQFSNFFNAYTKAYNKQNNRKGSLFIPRFNRKKIISEQYLKNTLLYIHLNPVVHGYVKELDEWKYSSYTVFLNNKPTNINKKEAISWFDNKENFSYCHNIKKAEQLALEMDLAY